MVAQALEKGPTRLETLAITAGPEAIVAQSIAVIEAALLPSDGSRTGQLPKQLMGGVDNLSVSTHMGGGTHDEAKDTKPPQKRHRKPKDRRYPTELDHMHQTQHLLKPSLDIAGIIARNKAVMAAREQARTRKPGS